MSDRNRRGSKTTDSYAVEVQDTFTRPGAGDTTQYSLNDVISATTSNTGTTELRPLALGPYPGKPFWLTYLALRTNLDTFICTVRVHFYTVAAPATAVNGDNAAFSRAYANVAQYIGFADLPALSDYGDLAAAQNPDIRMLLAPAAGSASVYYRLEIVSGTPTPSSGQSFTLVARSVDA